MSTVGKRHLHDIKLSFLLLLSLLHSYCLLKNLTLDDIIKRINKQNLTWKAGRNKVIIPRQGGVLFSPFARASLRALPIARNLPKNFDAREKWPYCPSLRQIKNQKKCGSCWAVLSASVMSDRLCIKSKGRNQFEFSAEELITCCDMCKRANGCKGGALYEAFRYWEKVGMVSGGEYGSRSGCKPYSYSSSELGVAPNCSQDCTNRDYKMSYTEDKRYGEDRYYISGREILQVQSEIFTKGPVAAVMEIYTDFSDTYKHGIYVYKRGTKLKMDHGVKLIGWGVEHDVPYWVAANSWGPDWGDNGFFKILKGYNHCGIETVMVAATAACSSLIGHLFLYLSISIFCICLFKF